MDESVARITKSLAKLTPAQLAAIDELVEQFLRPYLRIDRNPELNLIDDTILADFGDMIRLHHCFSKGPFSKDKFEYALELSLNQAGYQATLAPPSNPTYDITIEHQKFSLKTEAAQAIKLNAIHISKFMELGKGTWEDKIKHLAELRDRFLDRLTGCDRILTLRNFQKNLGDMNWWRYPFPCWRRSVKVSFTLTMIVGKTQNLATVTCLKIRRDFFSYILTVAQNGNFK